jgi:hypothetical protein
MAVHDESISFMDPIIEPNILGKIHSLQNTIDRYLKHTEGTLANGKVETGIEVHPIHSFTSLV